MHALTRDEMVALQDMRGAEDGVGTPATVGKDNTVNVTVLTLNRLEQRGMIEKVGTLEQDGGSELARRFKLTDKGHEALDQSN